MQSIAFELRAEFVDTFAGGVLAVGDGDFHVRDELERGSGQIVVQSNDQRLVDLLDAYRPLKRAKVAADARPISPYERQSAETIQHAAELRGVKGAGHASRDAIQIVLDAHDRALAAKPSDLDAVDFSTAQQFANAVLDGDPAAVEHALTISAPPLGIAVVDAGTGDASPPDPALVSDRPQPFGDGVISDVGDLTTEQLVAALDYDTEAYPDAGRVELPAARDELRKRAIADPDGAEAKALADHNLSTTTEG